MVKKTSKPKEKKPDGRINNPNAGRPKIKCTPELAEKICNAIATTSASLKQICRDNAEFPNPSTIFQWIAYDKVFSNLYLEAKQRQVLVHMEETYEIAEDSSRDEMVGEHGESRFNGEFVARSKLRIELRKWQAARLMPRLFGDKAEVTNINVADEELKSTVSELKKSVDLLSKHEKDY